MKSRQYIRRLFKDYKILTEHVETIEKTITWYRFKLTKYGTVNCIYDICIRLPIDLSTAKERRENDQAWELVKAIETLPRY